MNVTGLLTDTDQTPIDAILWKRAWRVTITTIVASLAIAFSTLASAQESEALDEIRVTGSHIKTDTFSASSPLAVIDSKAIEGIGATNVGNLIARLPSIVSETDSTSANVVNPQSTGIHTTALRNLGASRTLVLVNGRRYVSGTSAGAGYGVDLNSIPVTMIERVEVLTGGQSAVYGSDAIAGVINIITKTDFDGVSLKAQGSQNSGGDRSKQDISLTVGKSFSDGSNVWFSAGYSNDDGLLSADRDFSKVSQFSLDGDGDGLADFMTFLGSSHVPGARLIGGGLSLNGDGTPFNGNFEFGNSDRLNFNEFRNMLIPLERRFAAGGMTLDFGEKTDVTMEMNYARVESQALMEAWPLNTANNVFLVNRGGASGIDLTTHPLFVGSSAGTQLVAAGVTSLDQMGTFRRVIELGQLGPHNVRSTLRFSASVDHRFDNGMALNVYGTYGVTDQNQINAGDINVERVAEALNMEPDGFGGYQCSSIVARRSGCVPVNPFGTVDSIAGLAGVTGFSPAGIDYIKATTGIVGSVEQTVVSGVLTGDLPFNFGSQDETAFAVGLEYRKEEGSETPDGFRQQGIAQNGNLLATNGEFDVVEVFGELHVPVLEKLDLDLALRIGDYSTIGTATTWKVGLNAPVSDSFRLRAAVSTAVRAPNVSDLFAGAVSNSNAIIDPCGGVDAATAGIIAENCRSIQAIQDRITATGAFTLTQTELQGTNGFGAGSPTVNEETADSFTAGIVFEPTGLDGLSIALDFYSIEIEDAIIIPPGNTVLDRCHNVDPSSFDPTCGGLLLRSTVGPVIDLFSVTNNEDTIDTSGVDLEVVYNFRDFAGGDLILSLFSNFITKYEVTGSAGDVTDLKGEVLFPETRFNLSADYARGELGLYAQLRYRGETKDRNDGTIHNSNLNEFDSVIYLDLRGSYQITDRFNVYLGANNVLEEDPPVLGEFHKYYQRGTETNGTAFDVIGRQVYLGASLDF